MTLTSLRPVALAAVLVAAIHAFAQPEPPHPILSIPGRANTTSANNIVNNHTETQYTNNFVPRQSPQKTNLLDAAWQDLGGPISSNSLILTPQGPASYYRIKGL